MSSTLPGQLPKLLWESSSDLIFTLDVTGHLLEVNTQWRKCLGYATQDLHLHSFTRFILPEQQADFSLHLNQVSQGKSLPSQPLCFLTKTGVPVAVELSMERVAHTDTIFCLATLPVASFDWHRALVENGADLLALVDAEANFLYSGGGTEKLIGYLPAELEGHSVFDFLHPEDVPVARQYLLQILEKGQVFIPEVRFKSKQGDWKWLETIGTNHLRNPAVRGIVLNSREITERLKSIFKLEESEQRFLSLFENNPDVIIMEDAQGTVLEANPAFLNRFGATHSRQVIGRHISEFLPATVVPLSLEMLKQAFLGKNVTYEITIPHPRTGESVLSISKIPVVVENNVVAVHTVMKDITETVTAHGLIKQQADKLMTVLESITDAYFLLDRNWCFSFLNHECDHMLGVTRAAVVGRHAWELFPDWESSAFGNQFRRAVETGQAVYFETQMPQNQKWVGVKAFPSAEGLSVYITDISDRIAAQHELEKLSLVASKTTNGVVITDSRGLIEWVNEGFTRMTGFTQQEVAGKNPGLLLQGEESSSDTVALIRGKLAQGIPFNASLVNYTKSGSKYWVSMDIAPIFHESGHITRFIAIQKDITFMKEAEASQLKMTRDLYLQNRDLQQFTYIVSHNLRAPVANALGLADLLTKIDKNSEGFEAALTNLKKSVFKLDTVLRDLNMILSIRDKHDVLEKEEVNLADLCQQVLASFEESMAQCQGQVVLDVQPNLTQLANRAYLYSIFYNLLSNAIKYRKQNETLVIKITIFGSPRHGTIIAFTDNGTGFDLQKAGDDVFKLYKRFHKDKQGRGVGLFLVKAHVEAMEGKIEVSSVPNRGTKFLIHLK